VMQSGLGCKRESEEGAAGTGHVSRGGRSRIRRRRSRSPGQWLLRTCAVDLMVLEGGGLASDIHVTGSLFMMPKPMKQWMSIPNSQNMYPSLYSDVVVLDLRREYRWRSFDRSDIGLPGFIV